MVHLVVYIHLHEKAAPALLASFLSRTLLVHRMCIIKKICNLSASHWPSYISVDKKGNCPWKAEPEI